MPTTSELNRSDPLPGHPTRPAPPAALKWLQAEVDDWQREGLVSQSQSAALLSRYHAARRVSAARLLLGLGATFVGFGLIWLVAANLDNLTPTGRLIAVAVIWAGVTTGAELLAVRRAHGGPIPSPVVHAGRLLGALLFGAVIFQAAQSLQVPAYEPRLMGVWALGALIYGYLVRAAAPVVVGVTAGLSWVIWDAAWQEPSALGIVLAVAAAGVGAVSIASLHDRFPVSSSDVDSDVDMAWPWRAAGTVALLGALFASAMPFLDTSDFSWTITLGIVVAAAALLAGGAALSAVTAADLELGVRRWLVVEPLGAVAVTGLAVLLLAWDAGADSDSVEVLDWFHAGVAVVGYLLVSAGVAALGVWRDRGHLTVIAVVSLVVFTTFQSFAVFAQIIQGAWLLLAVGLILAATGWLADRGRRKLAASLSDRTDDTVDGGAR